MFDSLSLSFLVPIFIVSGLAVWAAGIYLSDTTDILDIRFKLGEAMGGLIILAITTNLPEIAIVVNASLDQHFAIAIGNILGGIAIQTVVLVFLDSIGLGRHAPLSYQAPSLELVLEAVLLIIIILITILGSRLPKSLILYHLAPGDILVVVAWLSGIGLINKARKTLPWHLKKSKPVIINNQEILDQEKKRKKWNMLKVILIFSFSSIVTLVAGTLLEKSGIAIAKDIGWSGGLFGATILAATTALPEISTGLAAVKIRDYTLAFSDIFGGNAFLPVLFFLATLISGKSLMPYIQNTDIYLAALGALLTGFYIFGLIFRSKRQFFNLGIDSILVLIFYVIGIIGLFFISL